MSPSELAAFVQALQDRGVQLAADGDTLRFRAPRGALTDEERRLLSEHKPALLALLRAPVAARPIEIGQALSRGQRALWFLHRMNPGGAAYNVAFAATLYGAVEPAALQRALRQLATRHAMLCSRIVGPDEEPRWRAAAGWAPQLSVLDADRDQAALRRRVQLAAEQPFVLAGGELVRAALYRTATDESVFLMCAHHIVVDAWSFVVLLRELFALYDAARAGTEAGLPTPPAGYADFVRWQEELLRSPVGARQRAYWLQRFSALPPPLELPTDRPRPRLRSEQGDSVPLRLDPQLTAALQALAQREQTTLFTVLAAGLLAVLYRYSGQSELVLGTPYYGRSDARFAQTVGYHVNTLPLRVQVDGTQGLRSLVQSVDRCRAEALDAPDYPLALLVEELRQPRDPGRTPLFQVLFAFENVPAQDLVGLALNPGDEGDAEGPRLPLGASGLSAAPFPLVIRGSQHDLSLSLVESRGRIVGRLDFSTELFDAATARRLGDCFQRLLAAGAAAPEQPLAELPLLSDSERRLVLHDFNHTAFPHDLSRLLPQRLSQAAAEHAHAPAVISDAGTLLYADLERQSNQLAHRLQSMGIGPERLVGLCMPPCQELLVGLCGILKAGGAYVPLSPDLPDERLRWLVQDSGVSVILTDPSIAPRLTPLVGSTELLRVDEQALLGQPEVRPDVALTPSSLAYALYTSGSTGQPKAALIEHRSLLNLLLWMQRTLGFTPQHTTLQCTSISFDASVWELLLPLLCGAALVMPQPGRQREPVYLSRLIEQHTVAVLQSVPSLLRLFLESAEPTRCSSLRIICSGGEQLLPELAERCFQRLPDARLYNLYGPTECTINATFWPCERGAEQIPIGLPADNTRIYVLDERLQPVPIGVPGELFIAGTAVGRGYLNRPELTTRSFLPDPFAAEPGARRYRTGDLARWLPTGAVAYLGRRDGQIKLRGQRIELAEIEAVLREQPEVHDCAVALLTEPQAPSEAYLAGYVVPRAGAPSVEQLQAALRRRLPEAWVPGQWVFLTELPLTASGKLDRKRLPAPPRLAVSEPAARRAPRTATERRVAELFCALLGQSQVGLHDSFFTLGGHSLLALRLISLLSRELGVELPLQALFEAPTPALLAERVDTAPRAPAERPTAEGRPDRSAAAPLSPSQNLILTQERRMPGRPYYNVPVGMWLKGELDMGALQRALDALVVRHQGLCTLFFTDDAGQDMQRAAAPLPCPLQEVDLSGYATDPRAEAERLATEEARRAFDLHTPPLLRAAVYHVRAHEHLVLLVLHHIISDGASVGILWRDLALLYGAERTGVPAQLPPLKTSFIDHVIEMMRPDQEAKRARDVLYFRERLEGVPVLRLPLDHARPEARRMSGSFLVAEIATDPYRALDALTAARGMTLFTGVLASVAALIVRWSGQGSFCIGVAIAGRDEVLHRGVVGCFTNSVVVRVHAEDDPSFLQLLERLGAELRGALAHAAAPLASVVTALAPRSSPQVPPLFQVSISFNRNETPDWPGGVLERALIGTGITRRDMDVFAQEQDGRLMYGLIYDVALFERSTIERQAARLVRLFTAAVADPHAPLSRLELGDEDPDPATKGIDR